jgi:hypothetical protein
MTSYASGHVKNTPPPLILGSLPTIYEDNDKCMLSPPPAPIDDIYKRKRYKLMNTLTIARPSNLNTINEDSVPSAPTQSSKYHPFTEIIEKI